MDTAINSLRERFDLLNHHCLNFGFLYNINLLKNWEHETLLNHCKDLAILLSVKETSDINAVELFEELKIFCQLTEPKSSPNKILSLFIIKNYKRFTLILQLV
jgi:hypothetical protein